MIHLQTRLTSSLEKNFPHLLPARYPKLQKMTALRGQHLSCQLFYRLDADVASTRIVVNIQGTLAPFTTLRTVQMVPVFFPHYEKNFDENYVGSAPGLYPDVLQPLHYKNQLPCPREQLQSVWIAIAIPTDIQVGEHSLELCLLASNGDLLATETVEVEVLNAVLPDHGMTVTQWFHCDCLAQYYGVEVFSERHWQTIENFMRTAVEYGQNMILTPLFTPPLDTAVGGERLTTQLIGVTLENDKYTFDFTRLDRFMDTALAAGMKYFEMSHLFTQWGAAHAPKIMASVNGEYRRIFGWDTKATEDEYKTFLQAFLPELVAHLKQRGLDKKCKYHISDEPTGEHMEQYRAASAIISPYVGEYGIMDALSSIDFYLQGVTKIPIPSSDHIEPFLKENVQGLWTYYCCVQTNGLSNRFISMPSWRNRALGMQCFKYDIAGFLHWGYNFYNNMYSSDAINPYLCNDGEAQVPAGDAFVVYPAQNGEALPSLRLEVFREAFEDVAAMKLCAELCGKETVVAAMERALGREIRFDDCPHTAAEMLAVRAAVDRLIKQNV